MNKLHLYQLLKSSLDYFQITLPTFQRQYVYKTSNFLNSFSYLKRTILNKILEYGSSASVCIETFFEVERKQTDQLWNAEILEAPN